MSEFLFPQESYALNGAAMEVYNILGRGFLEAVYQEAMEIELTARNIPFEPRKKLIICYKDVVLQKHYEADFLYMGRSLLKSKRKSV